jgi:hypothetical protein
MKIIDLLNKIVNREYVPEKIKYKNEIYKRYQNVNNKLYYYANSNKCKFLLAQLVSVIDLFYEVEVIEESKKLEIPKHIPNEVIQDLDRAICPANVKCIAHKINEIINYLQYKEKKENE